MSWSDDVLELESETPNERLARLLAEQDADLLHALVQVRKARELSQQDVADLLGLTQPTIADFERYDNDPKLSTLRRYALAVGAHVGHAVQQFSSERADEWESVKSVRFLSFPKRDAAPRSGWVELDKTA